MSEEGGLGALLGAYNSDSDSDDRKSPGGEKKETQAEDANPAPAAEQAQEKEAPKTMQIANDAAEEALDNEPPEQGPQPPPAMDPEAAYAYPGSDDDNVDQQQGREEVAAGGFKSSNLHNFDALPPELASTPPGESDPEVQARVARWLQLQQDGRRLTDTLRSSKDYRNPEFFKKMVEYWEINEHGTAFTPELFNPGALPKEDSIEELKKELAAEDQKKKAGRAAGTAKIEFTQGSGAGKAGGGGGASSSAAATATATAAAIKAAQAMAQKLAANRGR